MKIICIQSRLMGVNTYICYDENSPNAILIDPSFDTDIILMKIESLNLNVTDILLTHGHFDHIYNIDILKNKTGAATWAHTAEKPVITETKNNASENYGKQPFKVFPDNFFDEGEYNFAGINVRVIHTPGHTQGSSCFLFEKHNTLITGDTLFRAGIGRTDLATGNHSQLVNSIRNKLLVLPNNTTVLPGHGDQTTIEFEKSNNPYL